MIGDIQKDKQIELLSMVLNNPNEDIEMASFWKSEPNKAEWNSCRRIIYYGLVFCSIFNCIYVYWFKATNLLNRL